MHERILLATVILAGVGATGCQSRATEAATLGAPPSVSFPVGPVPGPGEVTSPSNPYADNAVAASEGRQLFVNYNCYGCHGGHGGGGMGPSLRDDDWTYGSSPAHIFASISEGRAHGMPAWGTKLPQDQIWKLVTYIKSMRTATEPDPPPPFPGVTPSDQQVLTR